jgi:uncharacterized protein YjbI with pentapeptide repeats
MNIRILSIALLFGFGVQIGFAFDQETLDFVKQHKRLPKTTEIKQKTGWIETEGDLLRRTRDLSRADLTEADLTGADLSNANFSNANFSGADLTGAKQNGTPITKDFLRKRDALHVDTIIGIN